MCGASAVWAAVALVATSWVDMSREQAASVSIVPADAPMVVHLKGWDRSIDRLEAMIVSALPGGEGRQAASFLRKKIEEGLADREIAGLAEEGPIFFAITRMSDPAATEPPDMAVFAKVTDFKLFRAGILTEAEEAAVEKHEGYESTKIGGQLVCFAERDGFAIVTFDERVAKQLSGAAGKGMNTRMSERAVKSLLSADLGFYFDLRTVRAGLGKEKYDQIIATAMQAVETQIKTMQGISVEMKDIFKLAGPAIEHLANDTQSASISIRFEPQGLWGQTGIEVAVDSPTSNFLKGESITELAEIESLPDDYQVYSVANVSSEEMQQLVEIIGKAGGRQMGKSMQMNKDAKVSLTLSAARDLGYRQGVITQICADPGKLVAAELAMYRDADPSEGLMQGFIKEKPTVRESDQQHRGFELNYAHVEWDLDRMATMFGAGVPGMREQLETQMGTGMTLWFGTDGKKFVQVTAPDWPTGQKLFDQYLDSAHKLGDLPAYRDVRRQLPTKAGTLTLIDVSLYAKTIADAAMRGAGMPGGFGLAQPRAGQGFLGGAVVLQADHAEMTGWMPVTLVTEMRRTLAPIIDPIIQMQQQAK